MKTKTKERSLCGTCETRCADEDQTQDFLEGVNHSFERANYPEGSSYQPNGKRLIASWVTQLWSFKSGLELRLRYCRRIGGSSRNIREIRRKKSFDAIWRGKKVTLCQKLIQQLPMQTLCCFGSPARYRQSKSL